MPWLLTGHAAHRDTAIFICLAMLQSQFPAGRNQTINGTLYQNLVGGPFTQQNRGVGWATRELWQTDMILADSHPLKPFLTDTLNDNAAIGPLVGTIAVSDPRLAKLGLVLGLGGANYAKLWMNAMALLGIAGAAVRAQMTGTRPGWCAMLDAVGPILTDSMDDAVGGYAYYANDYTVTVTADPNGGVAQMYFDWPSVRQANHPGPVPATGLAFGSYQGDGASVLDFDYQTLARAALCRMVGAGQPQAPSAYASLNGRMHDAASGRKGPCFVGSNQYGPFDSTTWAYDPPPGSGV